MVQFRVHRASLRPCDPVLEISTLEELLAWIESSQEAVVIYPPEPGDPEWEIVIYDDYLE